MLILNHKDNRTKSRNMPFFSEGFGMCQKFQNVMDMNYAPYGCVCVCDFACWCVRVGVCVRGSA